MGDCLGKQDVAVLVKKEVHESELLFLASAYQKGRDRSPSEAEGAGANGSECCRFYVGIEKHEIEQFKKMFGLNKKN